MSRLLEISEEFRKCSVSKNSHDFNDEYSGTHPDALSDGDEKGKGQNNEQVGGKTDIAERNKQIAKNKYNKNNEYNDSTA